MKAYRMIPIIVVLAGSSAWAQGFAGPDGIRMGQPSYGGSGCPAGTASTTLSPDAQSLSILFDAYQVEAGGMSGKQVDRKSCNVAIPVTIPQGYSVSIIQIDYRGFNSLPAGAQSRFSVEYFFAGTQGPAFSRDFFGPTTDDFLINNQLRAEAVVWSSCGADVNLRANTGLFVQTNYRNEQAMATVDSADVQAAVVFQLQWKRCGSGGGIPVPAPDPYPTPYPTYPPAPAPGYGSCTIDSSSDYWGRTIYRVKDYFGVTLGEYTDYCSAERAMNNFERSGQCRGSTHPSPYPPRPTPRPVPAPMPPGYGSFQCTLATAYGSFTGTGVNRDQAIANARNACIYSVNNARICTGAPVSCYRR
ncbi:MAG TPA: DUF4360 domain-containing protein [Bdellovibrionota bacterium]|nr:DUF4360 domain-containing protein [Bdellovibrionota bacterium]